MSFSKESAFRLYFPRHGVALSLLSLSTFCPFLRSRWFRLVCRYVAFGVGFDRSGTVVRGREDLSARLELGLAAFSFVLIAGCVPWFCVIN